ncbi:uncharacterized protein LOC135463702 isoform X2 [Liolophura sinensis]|uniref:uncharacterized protein LOC135463702 isoform X2 n=1 Tax=Liolophura sinensis TaxID=3198878 RepID=UPI00315989E0
MVGKFSAIVLAVLLFCSFTIAKERNKAHKHHHHDDDTIDIDDPDGYLMDAEHTEGSGPDDDTERDDEDGYGSGAAVFLPGSGDGSEVPVTNRPTPRRTTQLPSTQMPLTPCQQLRVSSSRFKDSYVPRCTRTGEFEKTQCRGNIECWCVNPEGKIIQGTEKEGDVNIHRPDCEGGSNLTPCVYLRVKSEWEHLLGAFSPRCTDTGEFEKVQCRDNECWCADLHGREMSGTRTVHPNKPNCDLTDGPAIVPDFTVTKTVKPNFGTPETKATEPGNEVGRKIPDDDDDSYEKKEEETNEVGKEAESKGNQANKPVTIMGQPGILAGIIGGAVVGLLCAILLVMFIVYRMRKKDEGSYALDEPTKARGAYAYQKAPDREYYA